MKTMPLLVSLLAYSCTTEPSETPKIELWKHISSDSVYYISVSLKVSSQTYTDTVLMSSNRFYSNLSLACYRGNGFVQILGASNVLLKQFSFQVDAIPGRFYIDTLDLITPKKVIVTFNDFSGILTYELRSVQ